MSADSLIHECECGGEAKTRKTLDNRWHAGCTKCGLALTRDYETERDAILIWNGDTAPSLIEALPELPSGADAQRHRERLDLMNARGEIADLKHQLSQHTAAQQRAPVSLRECAAVLNEYCDKRTNWKMTDMAKALLDKLGIAYHDEEKP